MPEPNTDQLTQLQNCRDGILDLQARPEERRRWLEVLFTLDSPGAKDLVVELLTFSESPDVQGAVCGVIADRARVTPHRLDPTYVEPLVDLLGAKAKNLRDAAARALADFPDADIPSKLGQLAARTDATMVQRLGAIDALASKVDRRDVVRELMGLLDAGVAEITERAAAALEPASRETLGTDVQRWQAWWDEKSRLPEEAWLADRLDMYRERLRRVEREVRTYREETARHQVAVSTRLGELQREVFRGLAEEGQEARLVSWLDDPLAEVKLTASGIIKARIADEGLGPSREVLTVLLRLLREGSAPIRREVLLIVQNLKDPELIDAILTQLTREKHPPTRHAILRAVGRLNSPKAVPALILEIANPESRPECVREAAIALGQVSGHPQAAEFKADAVAALKSRYGLVSDEDIALRSALLRAMAGVADPSFTVEFSEAVETDDVELLRPAIRGMEAIGDASKLPRLRTLTGDRDPLVRIVAVGAIGQLGREDADLESLLTRLNPAVETNEQVAEAAWRGFCSFLSKKTVEARTRSAQRLRDMPDLEVRYLQELADELTTSNGNTQHLEVIHDRLGSVLFSEGKHADAAVHLHELYEIRAGRADVAAFDAGLRWLEAVLRVPASTNVGSVVTRLAQAAGNGAEHTKIIDTVVQYLKSPEMVADPERTRALLADLDSIPASVLGEAWAECRRSAAERVAPESSSTTGEGSP